MTTTAENPIPHKYTATKGCEACIDLSDKLEQLFLTSSQK
jgi:hypothetical protein